MTQELIRPTLNFRTHTVTVAAGTFTKLNVTGSFLRVIEANRDFEISFDGASKIPVGGGRWFRAPQDPHAGFALTFTELFIYAPAAGELTAEIVIGFGEVGNDSAVLEIAGTLPTRIEEIDAGLVAAGNLVPVHIGAQAGNVAIDVAAQTGGALAVEPRKRLQIEGQYSHARLRGSLAGRVCRWGQC